MSTRKRLFCVEQLAAVGEQRREILLEPPDLAFGPAAELGRVEQDAVVAPPAPHLARGELARIVDDPADRPVGHARQSRAFSLPCSTDFFDASTWTSRAPASLSSRLPTPV